MQKIPDRTERPGIFAQEVEWLFIAVDVFDDVVDGCDAADDGVGVFGDDGHSAPPLPKGLF